MRPRQAEEHGSWARGYGGLSTQGRRGEGWRLCGLPANTDLLAGHVGNCPRAAGVSWAMSDLAPSVTIARHSHSPSTAGHSREPAGAEDHTHDVTDQGGTSRFQFALKVQKWTFVYVECLTSPAAQECGVTGATPAGPGPQGVRLPLCQGRLLGTHAAGRPEAAPQGRAGALFHRTCSGVLPTGGSGRTPRRQPLP